MSVRRVAVISAGMSEPSSTRLLADRLGNSVRQQLNSVEVDVIDLRDIAVDVARSMLGGFAVGGARDAVRAVEEADAVIAATPSSMRRTADCSSPSSTSSTRTRSWANRC